MYYSHPKPKPDGYLYSSIADLFPVQNKVNYYSTLRSQVFEMLQPVLEEIQPR